MSKRHKTNVNNTPARDVAAPARLADASAAINPEPWEDVTYRTVTAETTGRELPVDRVPALARPGMVITAANLGEGKIIAMTDEVCIARHKDGRVWPWFWGEVELCDVRPDPAFITAGINPKAA